METSDRTNAAPANIAIAYTRLPLGTVIRSHVHDTDPPKIKIFIIVGYYNDQAVTIYFNSEVNKFINFSQELQALHIPFECDGRPFLSKDCYCDCSFISLKDKDQLHATVNANPEIHTGNLSQEDLDTIMITLQKSPTIKGTLKKRYGFFEYQTTT